VSATRLDTWPYFTITKSGVQYAIPAQATPQRDGTYRPVPVARNPKIAFPPPLATANPDGSAARRNYDIDEVIFTTWRAGMGFDTYPPPARRRASRRGAWRRASRARWSAARWRPRSARWAWRSARACAWSSWATRARACCSTRSAPPATA
jgi:hypothetical protein